MMDKLETMFEETFSKYVTTDSFRLPMSVKELKIFTSRVCQEVTGQLVVGEKGNKGVSNTGCKSGFWSESESELDMKKSTSSNTSSSSFKLTKNTPIGLNSLSKTFNILQIVGQGHFGKVFKAENKFDRRIFAIKQIKINPREDLKKVLQEVENLSKVGKHKSIVKYLDCFLVQEEWDGEGEGEQVEESYTTEYTSTQQGLVEESSSFINFHNSASFLQQVREEEDEGEKHVMETEETDNEATEKKVCVTLSPHPRPSSAGYTSTLTCICIKMEFCDFTLEQLLDTLKVNSVMHDSLEDLFRNVTQFINFKENKSNSKFGAFCPLYILCQLLEGLVFIHNLGIVHRDLKPANIFIMQNGKVKIGDFGLSKDLSKESGLSKLYAAGTRFYMAPEFLVGGRGEEEIFLPPADMFSLGMVVVKMLGSLEMDESELFRVNDKLRRAGGRKEVTSFLRRKGVGEVAVGTTRGNLGPVTRHMYLPLLLEFLGEMVGGLLDREPGNRPSAVQAKGRVDTMLNEVFKGNDFFRPKIGAK